jgi:hypothetical protein
MQELIDALEKLAEIEESLPIRLDFDSARQRLYAEIGKRYVESYVDISSRHAKTIQHTILRLSVVGKTDE